MATTSTSASLPGGALGGGERSEPPEHRSTDPAETETASGEPALDPSAQPDGAGARAGAGGSSGDTSSAAAGAAAGDDRLSEALRAERRRSNQLEKELRSLRQQLTRFSEINPEEYTRLQEAERQKQLLEQQVELRERQMEEAAARRVAAVVAERDEATARVQELRKERLLERAFSEAEGRTGGDARGTFFQVFKGQLWDSFRLATAKDGTDVLEPLDGQGQPLLGDDGRPLSTAEFMDALRLHPVYGFLFQQRGAMGGGPMAAAAGLGATGGTGYAGFAEVLNPQTMSASELYRAGFVTPGRGGRS